MKMKKKRSYKGGGVVLIVKRRWREHYLSVKHGPKRTHAWKDVPFVPESW